MSTATQSSEYAKRWWTLAVLGLSLLIIGLDNTILNVAIPTLQREFDASASELQWMVDAYILVFAGLLLTMGALSDRFGRKLALQVGLGVFGAASVAAVFAETSGQLIAARAVMGVGGALIMPATLSIITHVFPREERGKAIGIWAAIAGIGIGLGPLLGGVLIEYFSWSAIFLVNVPIVGIALIAGLRLVPESRDPLARRIDIPGALLSIGALGALVYAIIEAPSTGWTEPVVLAAFGAAAILSLAFVWWERRTPAPMLNLDFFASRSFSVGAGSISVAFFALFGTVFLLTQYLQFVKDYTALEAGLRIAPIAFGLMLGAGLSDRFVHRFGANRVVAGGLLGLAIALASISFWTETTAYWLIAINLIAISFSMGNIVAPATDAVMGAVPEAKAGVGSAMNDVTRQVGGALGVAIIGSILNSIYSSSIEDSSSTLPAQAAEAARDSIGAASIVAETIPDAAGRALDAAAAGAFIEGLGTAVLFAGALALLGAGVVLRFLPNDDAQLDATATADTAEAQ